MNVLDTINKWWLINNIFIYEQNLKRFIQYIYIW
jgi:hypothetical protein